MNDHDLIEVAVALITIGTALLGKLVWSISELNKNIAVVVSRVDSHEKRIDRLESIDPIPGQY